MTSPTKTLAIVGAGPGLGLSIAKRFGAAGFQVALLARSADKLDGLAGELDKLGVIARAYVADLADRPSVAAAARAGGGGPRRHRRPGVQSRSQWRARACRQHHARGRPGLV
jgi:NAD(P)-dependent dehydrogenase (short-subunit alcohol dehydrogenase family)